MAIEDLSGPGGIVYSPASGHSKELAKWEMRPLPDGSVNQDMINAARRAGMHHGAWEHQEYPKAMVLAAQTPNGIKITETRSAQSDVEEANLLSRGYRMKACDAVAYVESQNVAVAEAAANRAFNDRRLSPKAQDEADVLDRSTARHLGEIPAAPIRTRVRRTKAQLAAAKE